MCPLNQGLKNHQSYQNVDNLKQSYGIAYSYVVVNCNLDEIGSGWRQNCHRYGQKHQKVKLRFIGLHKRVKLSQYFHVDDFA